VRQLGLSRTGEAVFHAIGKLAARPSNPVYGRSRPLGGPWAGQKENDMTNGLPDRPRIHRLAIASFAVVAAVCACKERGAGDAPPPPAEAQASVVGHEGQGHDHRAPAREERNPAEEVAKDATLAELIALLKSEQAARREQAARLIGKRKGAAAVALDALVAAFGDTDTNVRLAAVETVGAMGAEAAAAIPPLIALFDDPVSFKGDCGCVMFPVRIDAIRTLSKIGNASLEPVLAQAKHERANRRECAVVALGEMKRADPAVIGTLIAALGDEDRLVREKAADALGAIGQAAAAALPALEKTREDPVRPVAKAARLALEAIRAGN
jgi:HEAT repeat protein